MSHPAYAYHWWCACIEAVIENREVYNIATRRQYGRGILYL